MVYIYWFCSFILNFRENNSSQGKKPAINNINFKFELIMSILDSIIILNITLLLTKYFNSLINKQDEPLLK